MVSTSGFEPGPHWWEASALATAPSLAQLLIGCAEFGGELRNQQRPKLEEIDMKYGRLNQRKNLWNINVCDS